MFFSIKEGGQTCISESIEFRCLPTDQDGREARMHTKQK